MKLGHRMGKIMLITKKGLILNTGKYGDPLKDQNRED